MQPIGPLMHEHRLIERMVVLIKRQADFIEQGKQADFAFIADAVEFFRTYADRCHHGKEEDILFRDLRGKDLPADLSGIMDQLMLDHKQGRKMVGLLAQANTPETSGERLAGLLNELASFYPKHILKEDKEFFFPVMEYFPREEMDRMLAEFHDFDQKIIHEFFEQKVTRRESGF